jgi:hypothetical protein
VVPIASWEDGSYSTILADFKIMRIYFTKDYTCIDEESALKL